MAVQLDRGRPSGLTKSYLSKHCTVRKTQKMSHLSNHCPNDKLFTIIQCQYFQYTFITRFTTAVSVILFTTLTVIYDSIKQANK